MTNRSLLIPFVALVSVFVLFPSVTASAEEVNASQSVDWWIEQALNSLSEIDDKNALSGASHAIVYSLIRNGRLDEATRVAKDVINLQKRVYVQTAVAKEYLKQGDEAKYLALMHELVMLVPQSDKKPPSNFPTSHLLTQYTESGHITEAVAFAAQLPGKFQQSGAYQNIANGLAQQGKLHEAYQLIDEHSPKEWSQNAAVGIAYAVARAGRVEETENAIKRLQEVKHRDNTYMNLAKALAVELHTEPVAVDQVELAKQYAAKIVDPVLRSKTLAEISAKQVRNEKDVATLESMLARADTREQQQAIQRRLHEVFIEKKMIVEAEETIGRMLRTIETTPRDPMKSKFGIYGDKSEIAGVKLLYVKTAILLAEQGDEQASHKRLKWATLAYNEMPEAAFLVKVQALPTLIRAYVKSGDKEGARKILIKRIADTKSAFQKSSLATLLIHAGDIESAMQLSKQMGSGPTAGYSLGRVASSFIQAGEFASAKELLETLNPTSDEQEAYRVVARAMVDGGQIVELKQWLPKMPSPAARVYACQGAINGLAQK